MSLKKLSTITSRWNNHIRFASSELPKMPDSKYQAPAYEGPSPDRLSAIHRDYLNPALKTYYKKPLLIHSGRMQWLFDEMGKRYLDMFAGIVTVSVGHCHPRINEALSKQMDTLWHTTNIYMNPKINQYAEKLASKFPGDLKSVYFVNSGSEANDLAMMLARLHTGNHDLICFNNAYHGMSPYTMGLTAQASWGYPISGLNSGIHHVMNPDPYQGLFGGKHCRDSPCQTDRECDCGSSKKCVAAVRYYDQLEQIFKYSIKKGKLAGMFAESMQGVGGTVQYPKGYIKRVAELVRDNGGLFISDEVQTGFGRTGEHFWGFEGHDIVPDIVTMAKGIGNGFPLAAVITTPKIAECMKQGSHFNTFGGNPLASTVGMTVLDIIEDEKLQQNSLEVGNYFLNELEKLKNKYEIVGDVRGKGLMIGVEFVEDKKSRKPLNAPQVMDIWDKCKELGVLFGRGGNSSNVLRIKPPMCITKEDVKFAVEILEYSIKQFS